MSATTELRGFLVAADKDGTPRRAFVDRPHAAEFLGIGTTTLDKLIASTELRSSRIGRRVLIHVDDLHEFADQLRNRK